MNVDFDFLASPHRWTISVDKTAGLVTISLERDTFHALRDELANMDVHHPAVKQLFDALYDLNVTVPATAWKPI